ncbi:MAG: type II RES/Xre toxin-antitoxin system antitoxin [Candidatus Cyclobacteriaceae bacterium M3_2C_046]
MKTSKSNPYRLIDEAEKGIDLDSFENVVRETGYTREYVANAIGLNVRTINNYRKKGKELDKKEAEHLLKFHALIEKGIAVFGSSSEFRKWLDQPAYGLDHRVPNSLLGYISGIDLIDRELTRIEYGDFS